MRLHLAGYSQPIKPLVLTLPDAVPFQTTTYTALGYTHFQVMCIGGAGGRGSNMDSGPGGASPYVFVTGGAGGGGGSHLVSGLLSTLPASVPVTVGKGGADSAVVQAQGVYNTAQSGVDGGASTFGTTCQASGGKGGTGITSESGSVSFAFPGTGGSGGRGGTTTAGNGGTGNVGSGVANRNGEGGTAVFNAPATNTEGTGYDGIWTPSTGIGFGGGGGAGSNQKYNNTTVNPYARPGGRGSYFPNDISVYSPGDVPRNFHVPAVDKWFPNALPGTGGGAKASPVTGLPTLYGTKGFFAPGNGDGIVVIRLTKQ